MIGRILASLAALLLLFPGSCYIAGFFANFSASDGGRYLLSFLGLVITLVLVALLLAATFRRDRRPLPGRPPLDRE